VPSECLERRRELTSRFFLAGKTGIKIGRKIKRTKGGAEKCL
jgi:hypothetical protein